MAKRRKAKASSSNPSGVRELATALGVSVTQLYRNRALGMPMSKVDGVYDLAAARAWLGTRRMKSDSPSIVGDSDDGNGGGDADGEQIDLATADDSALRREYNRAQIRLRRAQEETARLKLSVERGEYMSMAQVRERDIARVTLVRSRLLGGTRRLAAELQGLDARQMRVALDNHMRGICEEFARMSQ